MTLSEGQSADEDLDGRVEDGLGRSNEDLPGDAAATGSELDVDKAHVENGRPSTVDPHSTAVGECDCGSRKKAPMCNAFVSTIDELKNVDRGQLSGATTCAHRARIITDSSQKSLRCASEFLV